MFLDGVVTHSFLSIKNKAHQILQQNLMPNLVIGLTKLLLGVLLV
jgi:hypothetical protein